MLRSLQLTGPIEPRSSPLPALAHGHSVASTEALRDAAPSDQIGKECRADTRPRLLSSSRSWGPLHHGQRGPHRHLGGAVAYASFGKAIGAEQRQRYMPNDLARSPLVFQ